MSSEPSKGDWYRNNLTGDLYQIRVIDGKLVIARDLPNSVTSFHLSKINEFTKEEHPSSLLPGQMARISFECDSALCRTHMDMPRPKAWIDCPEKEKAEWIEGRIHFEDDIRKALYIAVNKVLLEFSK